MNTYKTKNHPYLPDGIEGTESSAFPSNMRVFVQNDKKYQMGYSISFMESHPEWFAPVVDYKQKLEVIGFECKYNEISKRYAATKGSFIAWDDTYEAIYNTLTWRKLESYPANSEAEETKAEMIGRAGDPVTLDEIRKFCKSNVATFECCSSSWTIEYESATDSGWSEEELKTLLRS